MAKIEKVSPLAPASFPHIPSIKGVNFSTASAGVKYQGRSDVMLAVLDPGTEIAGVFTSSSTRSFAVIDCEEKIHLKEKIILKNLKHSQMVLLNRANQKDF